MEKFDKIISIICSVYLCYYIMLIDENKREEFNNKLKESLIILFNSVQTAETDKNDKAKEDNNDDNEGKDDISSKIQNKSLKLFIQENGINHFSDFLRVRRKIFYR